MADPTPPQSPRRQSTSAVLQTPPRSSPSSVSGRDGAPKTPQTPTGRTQALKDLKLTIEYKHLKQNAPGGVLVTPAFNDLRTWHGVIFVRKGCYQGGVFKFVVKLPRAYNDHNVWPEIRFTSRVSNPFIAPFDEEPSSEAADAASNGDSGGTLSSSSTATNGSGGGLLDIKAAYPTWDPQAHFMVTALTFVKKVFYLRDEDLAEYRNPANPASAHAFVHDKSAYLSSAAADAERSQEEVHGNPLGSPIAFQPPNPKHEVIRKLVVESEDHTVRSSGFVLEILKQAIAQVEAENTDGGGSKKDDGRGDVVPRGAAAESRDAS